SASTPCFDRLSLIRIFMPAAAIYILAVLTVPVRSLALFRHRFPVLPDARVLSGPSRSLPRRRLHQTSPRIPYERVERSFPSGDLGHRQPSCRIAHGDSYRWPVHQSHPERTPPSRHHWVTPLETVPFQRP